MCRLALACCLVAIAVVPATASAYPTHVPVSLTRIPGNICCPHPTRASVSADGVLTKAVEKSGRWRRVAQRRLTSTELSRLRDRLRRFDPSTLRGDSARCQGGPVGDVGGYELRVGKHHSNCPPASADRLIRLLERWLPQM